jgi:hypothetical protein
VFSLTDQEYRRWLELEAVGERTPEAEAELRGYLNAIAAAEGRVRRWLVAYLQAEHRRQPYTDRGADRADIYRALAPRLAAAWGARMMARVHGECRGREDAFAGKMLILDEALLALCSSGRVEAVSGPLGDTTFRLSSGSRTSVRAQEQESARASRRQAQAAGGQAGRPSPAATAGPDLRDFLTSLGAPVGFDE